MKKIPTLFLRDPENRSTIFPEVTPGCEWVLAGEGTPTRKYDGTCVAYFGSTLGWYARREVKPGKRAPEGFRPIGTDENTGKTVGWEPIEQSPFAKFLDEVLLGVGFAATRGTYELCGPKVNGNPEGFAGHRLISHDAAEVVSAPRDFDELRAWLLEHDVEGIVWHHPDGRMAKLKRRDFTSVDSHSKPR